MINNNDFSSGNNDISLMLNTFSYVFASNSMTQIDPPVDASDSIGLKRNSFSLWWIALIVAAVVIFVIIIIIVILRKKRRETKSEATTQEIRGDGISQDSNLAVQSSFGNPLCENQNEIADPFENEFEET